MCQAKGVTKYKYRFIDKFNNCAKNTLLMFIPKIALNSNCLNKTYRRVCYSKYKLPYLGSKI